MSGVQVGRPGSKYVRFTIDVWCDEKTGDIQIVPPGMEKFWVTVNDKPGSINCHQNLYNRLKQVLQEHGRWPGSATTDGATARSQPEA
jgi:hypothetical protein